MKKLVFSAAGVLGVIAGCASGGRTPPTSGGDLSVGASGADIARVHRTKCGACHARIEPGTRSRPELETALARHHARVHLADEDWQRMIDFLAQK